MYFTRVDQYPDLDHLGEHHFPVSGVDPTDQFVDEELEDVRRGRRSRKSSDSSPQTPLETYLREINATALLTAEEETMLAERIAQGDVEARDRMVRANLRLVVNIARGYVGKGLSLPDLIEEGNLGLLRAVEGFDPSVGTRFSTYASYWIKQSIKRALINSAKRSASRRTWSSCCRNGGGRLRG
jgi:RNA polymerase primary sigma factor